jgi:hypothetical protein
LGLKARRFLLEVLLRRPLRPLRLLLRRLALVPLPERLLDLLQQHNDSTVDSVCPQSHVLQVVHSHANGQALGCKPYATRMLAQKLGDSCQASSKAMFVGQPTCVT